SSRTNSLAPTEQFSFQTDFLPHLEISGRAMYSWSDLRQPAFDELFSGYVALSLQRQIATAATANAQRVSASGDLGVTWEASEKLRVHETVRYAAFRIPGQTAQTVLSLFAATALLNPNVFSSATCPPPFNGAGCPFHISNSPADSARYGFSRFLAQASTSNELEVEYDFSSKAGARIGHRWRHRTIDQRVADAATLVFFPIAARRDGCTAVQGDGSCLLTVLNGARRDTSIDEQALLAGLWLRPSDAVRVNWSL